MYIANTRAATKNNQKRYREKVNREKKWNTENILL